MRRTFNRLAIVAGGAMLSGLALAGTAAAHHSSPPAPTDPITGCGQVITTSTTMTHDVGPCTGDGIVIAGNGVTLNMAGHTITGGNLAGSPSAPGNAGVKFSSVTGSQVVGAGTIRVFNSGVVIDGGSASNTYDSGNTVDNVTVELNLGSLLTDYGEGITVVGSDGNTVKNTRVSLNGPYAGITLLGDSDYNKIGVAGGPNTVENNIEPSGTSNQDDGIRLEPDYTSTTKYPNNNVIENNTVRGNALDGISVLAGPCTNTAPAPCTVATGVTTANVIKDNIVQDNGKHTYAHRKGDGIRVFARAEGNIIGGTAVADRNTVTGNAASGIRVDSEGNTVQNNEATGNCAVPDPLRPCVGSRLVGTEGLPTAQGADLFDSIVPCGSTWTTNVFGTKNQSCIS